MFSPCSRILPAAEAGGSSFVPREALRTSLQKRAGGCRGTQTNLCARRRWNFPGASKRACRGSCVVLGVIPAGGGNDLAAAIGLPQDPLLAADLLLDGQPALLDAALVRTADGKERLYSGGGGVGSIAKPPVTPAVLPQFARPPALSSSAVRALMGFHPFRVRAFIGTDQQVEMNANALLLGVLNTPSYGAGLRLAPDAQTDDGKLDLVLMEDLSFWRSSRCFRPWLIAANCEPPTSCVSRGPCAYRDRQAVFISRRWRNPGKYSCRSRSRT